MSIDSAHDRHRSGAALGARLAAHRRADRRRHLHRLGHPRLPRARRASGRRTRRPRSSRTSTTTCPIPRCAGWRGSSASSIPHGRRRPTAVIRRWSISSVRGGCTRSSRRTSTACTSAPATHRGMVIEVHGTVHEYMCMSCGARGPMQKVLDRVRAGEDDPPCTDCNGILKSATISFGQALVPEVIDRAMDVSRRGRPLSRDRLDAAGVSRGRHRVARQGGRRPHRDRERRADGVRRGRRRGVSRAHRRRAAGDRQYLTRQYEETVSKLLNALADRTKSCATSPAVLKLLPVSVFSRTDVAFARLRERQGFGRSRHPIVQLQQFAGE